MKKRRNLDREGLEIYLLNLLLAYRLLLQISGLILLVFAIFAFTISPVAGFITLVRAIFLVSMIYSYQATAYVAKFGAWLGTISKKER